METVTVWRRLSTGVLLPIRDIDGKMTGDYQLKRWNAKDAACKLGENYTTLQEYLSVIRFGKKHNFPFSENLGEKVGVLIQWQKQERQNSS